MPVDSNRKSPRDVRWGGWSLRTCENDGSGTRAFERQSVAELRGQGGRLGPERVRLVPSSENNWPVPSPIHQSDSAWPRGNE